MRVSASGVYFIKQFEGLSLDVYLDVAGLKTVGYGHRCDDRAVGEAISKETAESLLMEDLIKVCEAISPAIKVPVRQTQFDALVSFAFNVGCHSLLHSTLLRKLNLGDAGGAAAEFIRWDHAGGQVVPGLHKRRMAEADLFRA